MIIFNDFLLQLEIILYIKMLQYVTCYYGTDNNLFWFSYDVDEVAAEHIQADVIIHYGKTALTSSSSIKTLFVFGHKQLNCDHVCKVFNSTYSDNNSKVLLMIQPQWFFETGTCKNLLISSPLLGDKIEKFVSLFLICKVLKLKLGNGQNILIMI